MASLKCVCREFDNNSDVRHIWQSNSVFSSDPVKRKKQENYDIYSCYVARHLSHIVCEFFVEMGMKEYTILLAISAEGVDFVFHFLQFMDDELSKVLINLEDSSESTLFAKYVLMCEQQDLLDWLRCHHQLEEASFRIPIFSFFFCLINKQGREIDRKKFKNKARK